MSGPKGYGYRVVSEEELRRRADAARLVRCTKLVSSIKGLFGIAERLGLSCEVPESVAIQASYSAEEEQSLIQTSAEVKKAIDDERRRLRVCSMKAELAETIRSCKYLSSEITEDDYIAAAAKASDSLNDESVLVKALYLASQDAKRMEAESIADSVAKSYGQHPQHFSFDILPAKWTRGKDSDSTFLEILQPVADAISEVRDDGTRQIAREKLGSIAGLSDPITVQGELLSLKNWLHSVLEAESWAELAAKEIMRIEHVESELADKARSMSENVSSRRAYAELNSAVSEALAEYDRMEDAQYVQIALREALEALGFTIGEEFSTTDFGEVGVAVHSSVPGYGIRIQNNTKSSQILTRVVSYSESKPDQDTRAELETCPMVHSLANELESHGVDMRLMTEKKPGECQVSQYAKSKASQRSARAKKTARSRERMM